jgi:hypothetical protein
LSPVRLPVSPLRRNILFRGNEGCTLVYLQSFKEQANTA